MGAAAVAVDLHDVVQVSAVGLRALEEALGDDGTRVFIHQFFDVSHIRPRVTTARIAEILEQAETKAKELAGTGVGDFTEERYERQQLSFEEVTEKLIRADAARTKSLV